MGGAPITFVQNLLGHESLATTGMYTRPADEMTREIALNTETALDGLEGTMVREGSPIRARFRRLGCFRERSAGVVVNPFQKGH